MVLFFYLNHYMHKVVKRGKEVTINKRFFRDYEGELERGYGIVNLWKMNKLITGAG